MSLIFHYKTLASHNFLKIERERKMGHLNIVTVIVILKKAINNLEAGTKKFPWTLQPL
jgi:phosphoribosylaminoimidazole carboxylase (NCAIR synthetase)